MIWRRPLTPTKTDLVLIRLGYLPVIALTILLASLVLEAIPAFDTYENWMVTHHFKVWLNAFQSPLPWSQIIESEVILLAVAASCFVIGCTAFQVRDIKS